MLELLSRVFQGALPCLPAFLDAGLCHDIGGRTGQVFFFLRLRQGFINDGLCQQCLFGYGAGCRHTDVQVITRGFQVVSALLRVGRDRRLFGRRITQAHPVEQVDIFAKRISHGSRFILSTCFKRTVFAEGWIF